MPSLGKGIFIQGGGWNLPSTSRANTDSRYWPQRSATTMSPICKAGSTPPAMPLTTMAGDIETLKRELGGHGGIDQADAAQEQHDRPAAQRAGGELHAIGVMAARSLEGRLQPLPFRLEGGDHRNTRRAIEPVACLQRRCGERRHEAQDDQQDLHDAVCIAGDPGIGKKCGNATGWFA